MNLELLLKILFDNTTLIAIFFAMGGLVKLFIYYKLFGIYIYGFIDIKEVVTLFINNLFGYFLVIGVIALALLRIPFLEKFVYVIPIAFSIFSVIYLIARKKVLLLEIIVLNFLFWLLFFVIQRLISFANGTSSASESTKNYTLLILLFILIVYSIANALTEFYKVKMRKYYSGTKIIYKSEEFTSDNNKYYIGKTEKYLFIYDEQAKTTEAISMSEVKKIIFRRI